MKLEDCTKEELVYFLKHECFIDTKTLTHCVLTYRRDKAFEKMGKESELAISALQEHIDLLTPYESKKVLDVPLDVIEKSNRAFKRYKTHSKKEEGYRRQYLSYGKEIDNLYSEGANEADNI